MKVATGRNNTYVPASYGSTETVSFINIAAGDVVFAAFCQVTTAFDGSPTAILGDGGSTNRFMTTTNTAITSATTLPNIGTGAGFATTPGYMYTSDDTIDIVYTTGGSPTVGAAVFWIIKFKAYPW